MKKNSKKSILLLLSPGRFDAAVFGCLQGLHVPAGAGKVRVGSGLGVVIVGPAAVEMCIRDRQRRGGFPVWRSRTTS